MISSLGLSRRKEGSTRILTGSHNERQTRFRFLALQNRLRQRFKLIGGDTVIRAEPGRHVDIPVFGNEPLQRITQCEGMDLLYGRFHKLPLQ